jgi:hypothetical protein
MLKPLSCNYKNNCYVQQRHSLIIPKTGDNIPGFKEKHPEYAVIEILPLL